MSTNDHRDTTESLNHKITSTRTDQDNHLNSNLENSSNHHDNDLKMINANLLEDGQPAFSDDLSDRSTQSEFDDKLLNKSVNNELSSALPDLDKLANNESSSALPDLDKLRPSDHVPNAARSLNENFDQESIDTNDDQAECSSNQDFNRLEVSDDNQSTYSDSQVLRPDDHASSVATTNLLNNETSSSVDNQSNDAFGPSIHLLSKPLSSFLSGLSSNLTSKNDPQSNRFNDKEINQANSNRPFELRELDQPTVQLDRKPDVSFFQLICSV